MRRFREPLAFLAIGAALIGLSRLGVGVPAAGGGDNRLAWQQLLFIYGVAALLFASMSYVLGHLGSSLVGCLRASWQGRRGQAIARATRRVPLVEATGVLVALGVGGWLRWAHLWQPMRLDEAYSFMTFVNTHWTNVFLYPFPNNHVVNSILERISCALLGTDEVGIRMPAMISGLVMIPLAFMVARRLGGPGSGWLAAMAIAVWPYLVLFSTNGRGYALMCVLTLLAAYVVIDDDGRLRPGRMLNSAMLGALGMLTMPSMLFPVAGLLLWMSMLWWLERRQWASVITDVLSPFMASFIGMTLLLYTPVALVSGGLQGVMANKEARALPIADFLHQAPAHVETAIRALGFGVPPWVLLGATLAGAWGVIDAWRRGRRAAALMWPAMLGGAMLLFLVKRSIPFPRTWIFLIPFWLLAADLFLTRLAGWLPFAARWMSAVCVVAAALVAGRHLIATRVISDYPETGVAPGAAQVAQELAGRLTREDYVCAMVPTNVVMSYELWRAISDGSRTGDARIFWVRRQLAGPSRGALDGWKTVVDAGPMIADVWAPGGSPRIVSEPRMDCWQPVNRKYGAVP